MRKLIIIDQDGKEEKNEIFDMLFSIREEELEQSNIERTKFIKENDLKDITHNDIIEDIKNISNLEIETREKILERIQRLLDNRARIDSFDCKLYYMAGANDIINIIFNGVT